MKTTILVVDDEQDMVDLLRFHLRERGYEVVEARNGWDAVRKARRILPHLILLDLGLDGLDGFAVCEILRHQPDTARLPILVITAFHGEMVRLNAIDSGADAFVTKPFSPEALLRQVDATLQMDPIDLQNMRSRRTPPHVGPSFQRRDYPYYTARHRVFGK